MEKYVCLRRTTSQMNLWNSYFILEMSRSSIFVFPINFKNEGKRRFNSIVAISCDITFTIRYLYASTVCEYAVCEFRTYRVSDTNTNLKPYQILLFYLQQACCASNSGLCFCLAQQQVTFYSFTDQSHDSNLIGHTDSNIDTDLYCIYIGHVYFWL